MSVVANTNAEVDRILTALVWEPDAVQSGVELRKDGLGRYVLTRGSSCVTVEVEPLFGDHSWITVSSELLYGVTPTRELFEHLAINGAKYRWGALSASPTADSCVSIWLTYGLLGTHLDDNELRFAVSVMLAAADDEDDDLQRHFGGHTHRGG